MAPIKGKSSLLELCTSSITLGNNISIHLLDYLSIVKDPPHGFNKLAVEFLETSRIIIPARTGLAEVERSFTQLPADITTDLLERFRQVKNAFTVLDQVVNRYLEAERKSGFGKIGKGFRMMFADNEIEKLRLSLVQCREGLARNHRMQTWSLGESQIEPAAGIGYTALSAVLDKPDPTRGKALARIASSNGVTTSPPELSPLPATPLYAASLSSRLDVPLSSLPDSTFLDRGLGASHGLISREPSSRTSTASPPYGSRTSSLPLSDNLSDITTATSIVEMDEMMSHQSLDDRRSKQPSRVLVDSAKVPRWTPSRQTGTTSAGSRTALLAAVQQQNHKMVEQLLDCGVPVDSGVERSLLTVAIVNNDFTSLRLLLLFGANPNSKDKDGYTPLFSATQASYMDAAQLLLKYSADPNFSASPYDESPFARALNSGQTTFVDLYLRYGADADAIMGNSNTAFIQAITKTVAVNMIELMLVYNAQVDCKNGCGETALFKAIHAERLDVVELLINHGANVNLPGPKHMLWPAVHQPRILELLLDKGADLQRAPGILELATSINSLSAIDILLQHKVDVNCKKDGIFTPLCTAIRDNRENLVDFLLSAGADPNCKASEYPAFKCITHHRPQYLPRLIAAGAKLDSPKGIIETAVAHNEKESLMFLLEAGVDVNARSTSHHTALTTAIKLDRIDLLDILLAHGADPGVRGQEWPITMAVKNPGILAKLLPHISRAKIIKGALEMAVVANQLESVKLLLAKGVSVEEKNGGVFSPLTTSIREDRKEIFRYLIDEAGADPNAPGEHLPIIKAIRRHREDDLSYIEHLITKGTDINLMYRGWNAVLQAVDNGDTQILKLLADRGNPDLEATDENGKSVLEIMDERGLVEEEQILLGRRSPSPQLKEANSKLRDLVQA